jgi:hypothetical protein
VAGIERVLNSARQGGEIGVELKKLEGEIPWLPDILRRYDRYTAEQVEDYLIRRIGEPDAGVQKAAAGLIESMFEVRYRSSDMFLKRESELLFPRLKSGNPAERVAVAGMLLKEKEDVYPPETNQWLQEAFTLTDLKEANFRLYYMSQKPTLEALEPAVRGLKEPEKIWDFLEPTPAGRFLMNCRQVLTSLVGGVYRYAPYDPALGRTRVPSLTGDSAVALDRIAEAASSNQDESVRRQAVYTISECSFDLVRQNPRALGLLRDAVSNPRVNNAVRRDIIQKFMQAGDQSIVPSLVAALTLDEVWDQPPCVGNARDEAIYPALLKFKPAEAVPVLSQRLGALAQVAAQVGPYSTIREERATEAERRNAEYLPGDVGHSIKSTTIIRNQASEGELEETHTIIGILYAIGTHDALETLRKLRQANLRYVRDNPTLQLVPSEN